MNLIEFCNDVPFPDPKNDGVDHLNIYSASKIKLGRMLSNFYYSPFTYEPYGYFVSGESFWYWYLTGQQFDELRTLPGMQAKRFGRTLERYRIDVGTLSSEIIAIMQGMLVAKLTQNPDIVEELIKCDLPLTHYYPYKHQQVFISDIDWFTQTIEDLRELFIEKRNTQ